MTIKVKKFKKRSRSSAISDYGLSEKQYDLVNQYIKENNLPADASVSIDVTPEGEILISTVNSGNVASSRPMPPTQAIGDYVAATLEPGKAPTIQGSTTDALISKGFAILVLIASALSVLWYASNFYFDVKDQIEARAKGSDNNCSNSLT